MIKSKRKNTLYIEKQTKASLKLDSSYSYDYDGESKGLGIKYRTENFYVNKTSSPVKKLFFKLKDLQDV